MDLGLAKPNGFLPEFQDEAGVGTKVPGDKKVKISISAHVQRTARHSEHRRGWFHGFSAFFFLHPEPYLVKMNPFWLIFVQMGWNHHLEHAP